MYRCIKNVTWKKRGISIHYHGSEPEQCLLGEKIINNNTISFAQIMTLSNKKIKHFQLSFTLKRGPFLSKRKLHKDINYIVHILKTVKISSPFSLEVKKDLKVMNYNCIFRKCSVD